MEIMAAYDAVKTYADDPRKIIIVSDSTYVVKCFNDKWWKGWHARDWKNSQRQPVANRDLWEPFIDLVLSRGNIEFAWVKGHSGDRMNDLVDVLAVAQTQGN
jgi:ribonuclease HI